MTANKELISLKSSDYWQDNFDFMNCVIPFVNIFENDDDFTLVANLPGVKRENIKLKIEDNELLIFGLVKDEGYSEKKFVIKENQTGNYFRKFNLSENINQSKIEAKYENGQLIIYLPKHENVKPKNIDIM